MNILLVVSAIIGTAGVLPYITAIRRGDAKPRFVTWSVWATLAVIMTLASFKGGHIASAILGLQGVVACGAVAVMGVRHGSSEIGRIDIISMIGVVLGLLSLAVFHQPLIALLVTIIIDGIAFVPTFIHGWTMPHEETAVSYVCGSLAAGLSLTAAILPGFSLSDILYPLYSVIANTLMVTLVVASRFDWRQYLDKAFAPADLDESTESA